MFQTHLLADALERGPELSKSVRDAFIAVPRHVFVEEYRTLEDASFRRVDDSNLFEHLPARYRATTSGSSAAMRRALSQCRRLLSCWRCSSCSSCRPECGCSGSVPSPAPAPRSGRMGGRAPREVFHLVATHAELKCDGREHRHTSVCTIAPASIVPRHGPCGASTRATDRTALRPRRRGPSRSRRASRASGSCAPLRYPASACHRRAHVRRPLLVSARRRVVARERAARGERSRARRPARLARPNAAGEMLPDSSPTCCAGGAALGRGFLHGDLNTTGRVRYDGEWGSSSWR